MNNNRNKAVRKITVEGVDYTWLVSDNNCDGDGSNRLKVWKNKASILDELIVGGTSITPGFISDKIKSLR